MKRFKSILFPLDFSECSDKVFPGALSLAKKFDAKLHIVFVALDISYLKTIEASEGMLMNAVAEVARAGEDRLEAFCQHSMADFPNYETQVMIGNPPERIVEYAADNNIDLIVMGTHGRRGIDRTLMGSVADYVIKHASAPVLTINPYRAKVTYAHT
jgi:nucleotide-binding universal stress UspA family protein